MHDKSQLSLFGIILIISVSSSATAVPLHSHGVKVESPGVLHHLLPVLPLLLGVQHHDDEPDEEAGGQERHAGQRDAPPGGDEELGLPQRRLVGRVGDYVHLRVGDDLRREREESEKNHFLCILSHTQKGVLSVL